MNNIESYVIRKYGLSSDEVLILNYIADRIDGSDAESLIYDCKRYYKISYKELFKHIPSLNKKERQTRRILTSLEKKNFIKRYQKNHNCLYINLNQELLFFGYDPDNTDNNSGSDIHIKFTKNCVKIFSFDAEQLNVNMFEFINLIKNHLNSAMSEYDYSSYLEYSEILYVSQNLIIISVNDGLNFSHNYSYEFKVSVNEALKELNDDGRGI